MKTSRQRKKILIKEIVAICREAGIPASTLHVGRVIAQTDDYRCNNLAAMIDIMQHLGYDAKDIALELCVDMFKLDSLLNKIETEELSSKGFSL